RRSGRHGISPGEPEPPPSGRAAGASRCRTFYEKEFAMYVRVLIALSLLACVPLTIAPNDAVGFTAAEVNKLIACETSIEAETKTLTRTTLDATRACLDAKLPPVLKHENGLIDDPTFTQLDTAAETLCLNQLDTLGPASTR